MSNKENLSEALTPKRRVSKCCFSGKKNSDETNLKDLLPPIFENMNTMHLTPQATPSKKPLEYLLSPSPVKKDLFNQLLGSDRRVGSPYFSQNNLNSMIMEESDYENLESESVAYERDSLSHSGEDEDQCESEVMSIDEGCWEGEEDGIKKRKRKSTNQIKMLKQELDGEMNWTKEKIVKMAEITGLSQSQVYKWCWDQKKKNIKVSKDQNKRKPIRKESRPDQREKSYPWQYEEAATHQKQAFEKEAHGHNQSITTKPKAVQMIDENENTEKKINKKLIFL